MGIREAQLYLIVQQRIFYDVPFHAGGVHLRGRIAGKFVYGAAVPAADRKRLVGSRNYHLELGLYGADAHTPRRKAKTGNQTPVLPRKIIPHRQNINGTVHSNGLFFITSVHVDFRFNKIISGKETTHYFFRRTA